MEEHLTSDQKVASSILVVSTSIFFELVDWILPEIPGHFCHPSVLFSFSFLFSFVFFLFPLFSFLFFFLTVRKNLVDVASLHDRASKVQGWLCKVFQFEHHLELTNLSPSRV